MASFLGVCVALSLSVGLLWWQGQGYANGGRAKQGKPLKLRNQRKLARLRKLRKQAKQGILFKGKAKTTYVSYLEIKGKAKSQLIGNLEIKGKAKSQLIGNLEIKGINIGTKKLFAISHFADSQASQKKFS